MTESDLIQAEGFDFERAVFLAATTRIRIPKSISKYIPQGNMLNDIAAFGLEGAKLHYQTEDSNLFSKWYNIGQKKSPAEGTDQEYRLMLAAAILQEMDNQSTDITLSDKIKINSLVGLFVEGDPLDELVGHVESSMGDESIIIEDNMVKWDTGFEPFDKAIGDKCYQGVHTVIARPGHGKTSILIAIYAALRKHKVASSLWYFSLEIPHDMMRWRMEPLRTVHKIKFGKKDLLIAGMTNTKDILERIKEDPDPNRVIFFDSPDVLAGGGDSKRHVLENIFRDLVMIKTNCKAVFTASQPRRQDSTLSMDSVAESWAKAWYSDTVFGIERDGAISAHGMPLRMTNYKNRFGEPEKMSKFYFDYRVFSYQMRDLTPAWEEHQIPQEGQQQREDGGQW